MRDATCPGSTVATSTATPARPRLYAAKLRPGRATSDRRTALSVALLVSFGEDAAGHVYAVSLNGPIYRIDAR